MNFRSMYIVKGKKEKYFVIGKLGLIFIYIKCNKSISFFLLLLEDV